MKDAREFAGAHRYETAEKLARRFASDAGGVSSVIVATGLKGRLADAVSASGLAGSMGAPVVLTRPDRLPPGVARFINEQNVTNVTIVGGTAVVSAAVETALKGLGSKPTVKRIAGADRYATAAMIGASLGGPSPTWCGSTQRAAILVNGAEENRADAIVAGPLAYRLGLPMLLTEADELPAVTRKFLVDNRIERVVVVGNAEAVSGSLINTLIEDVGVTEAPRIAGATAAATSVEVAKTMRGACKSDLNTDLDRLALVNQGAVADGIAAAPVLGRGLGNTGSIPILLVGGDLPAEVGDFLKTTPNVRAGNKTDLSIVAIGGKAVVTDAVMTAAVDAAKTSSDLTATISFDAKTPNQFTVTYSDDVRNADNLSTPARERFGAANSYTGANVEDPNLYRINGRRLSAAAVSGASGEGARASTGLLLGRLVTVTVGNAGGLKTGDKIEVVGGAQVGAAGDKRKLKEASHTIERPAAAGDTKAPRVEIFSYGESLQADIWLIESDPLRAADGTSPYTSADFRSTEKIKEVVKLISTTVNCDATCQRRVITGATGPWVGLTPGTGQQLANAVHRPGSDGLGGGIYRYTLTLSQGRKFKAGDVIEIARGTFLDKKNRRNALVRYTVPALPDRMRFAEVSIGNKQPTASAVGVVLDGTAASPNADRDDIVVTAKAKGIAAGSAGNGWRILGFKLPTVDTKKAVDIDVEVDAKNKIISYTWRNGDAKIIHLGRALAAEAEFADNFTFDYRDPSFGTLPNPTTTNLPSSLSTPVTLAGGKSAVAVRVDYNTIVWRLGGVNDGRVDRLAAEIMGRSSLPAAMNNDGGVTVWGIHNRALTYDQSVWISFESQELRQETQLPSRTGIRAFSGNSLTGQSYHSGNDVVAPAVFRGLRLDPSLKVCRPITNPSTNPPTRQTRPCTPDQ